MNVTPSAKVRCYPRAKVAAMMQKGRATLEAMQAANLAQQLHRVTDPFEVAKLSLQRAGIAVFAHSLHDPTSTLIVVGTKAMPREDVIAHAARYGR